MKITNTTPSIATAPETGWAKTANQAIKTTPSATDEVDISSLSARLQEASAAMTEPTIDTTRIAEIKQAITEGRFQVNPERIADGLLESVRQMLSRTG